MTLRALANYSPQPSVVKGIDSFATRVPIVQIELCKLKVVGISKPINRMGAPDTTHVSEKM